MKKIKAINCLEKAMVNFVYFYIAENNQKFYLIRASTQDYQEQLLLLHDLNKITL